MKKTLFALLIALGLLAAAQPALAENPDTLYGGWVKTLKLTGDSITQFYGYTNLSATESPIAVGRSIHYGGLCSLAVAKFTSAGTMTWFKHYGANSSTAYGVCTDGTYLWVTGNTGGTGYYHTIKYNASTGDTLYSRRVTTGGTGYGLGITNSGSKLYVVGQRQNATIDACLIKYRDTGTSLDTVWTRSWAGGGGGTDIARAVYAYNDNTIIVTGETYGGAGTGINLFIAKYDSLGNLGWSKTYAGYGTGNDVGYGISCVDTSIYITGKWSTQSNAENLFLMKCRVSTGDSVWLRNVGGVNSGEFGAAVTANISPNNWAIVVGTMAPGGLIKQAVVKFNLLTGDTVWTRMYPAGYGNGGASYLLDKAYVVGYNGSTPYTAQITKFKWLLPPPTLVQPVDSYNTYSTINFKWRNQPLVDSFRIQISTDTLFSAGGLVVDSLRTTSAPDTQFIFTPASDDTFYWRVKGYDYTGALAVDSTYWSDRHWVIEDRATPNINASLKADNGDPSPWSGDTIFAASYTTPLDMSGVRRALYKYGTVAPTGSYDTSGSATSNPFNVHSSLTRQKLWVWLQDYAGNVNYSSVRDTVILRYDNTVPGKVTAITADTANPSPWRNDSTFNITFTSPTDTSGIKRHYTKLGLAPTGAGDTLGARSGSKPFNAYSSVYGQRWLHVWEQDSAGNSGWWVTNRDSVRLRFDNVAPVKPTSVTLLSGTIWKSSPVFDVVTGYPVDSSGIKRHYYKIGSAPTGANDTTHTRPAPGLFEAYPLYQGIQMCYVWLQDSAGNANYLNYDTVRLKFDSIAPPAPTAVTANGASPSPWYSDSSFTINVTAGDAASGVMRYKTKLGSAPTGPDDTTRTYASSSFTVKTDRNGTRTLYVWTQDSANNSNYLNTRTVNLRYDNMSPAVNITSPPASAAWECGALKTISWTQADSGAIARDSVQYSIDGGSTWSQIYSGPPATSINGWTVPNTPGSALIRVLAKDSVGFWGSANSVGLVFSDTTRPAVAVNVPSGGQTWYCGASQTVSWTASDNVGVAGDSVYYTTDNGTSWNYVIRHVPAQSSYSWTIPATPSTLSRIRVKVWDAAGNFRMDASGGAFTIADSTKPTVTVTAPAGGETWDINSGHTLTWTQSDNAGVAQDSLLYSLDNGVTWTYITKIAASAGYSWTLPNAFSTQARVKVVAVDGSGNKQESISNVFSISDPSGPSVAVNAPNGGENWQALTSQAIGWAQSDNFGVVTDSLYYSTNSGSSWTPVWGGAATTSYLWSVPNPPSTTCRVKVVAIDGYGNRTEDVSNSDFVISASTISITVTSPNGGQSLTPGASVSITWTQSANVTSDTVQLSTDGGSSWSAVWAGAAATSCGWTVPNTPSVQCRIKVIAVENTSNKASDVSDANFTILDVDAPALAVTAPNGGESWPAGSTQTVTWTQSDNVAIAGDSLWSFDGGVYTLLYSGPPRTSLDWTLPLTPGTYWVRVAAWDASGNRTTDESDAAFSIVDNESPTVTLEYPIGGEVLGIGSTISVSWTQGDNIGVTVDSLLLSTDDGNIYNLLWTGLGTGYSWTVPNSPSAQCRMKIVARDGAGNWTSYTSGVFTIADNGRPVVSLTAPLGGETWYCGGSQNISWAQSDNVGITSDSVFFSSDEGVTWSTLYGGSPTTGYSWTVPNVNTTLARVLVRGYDAGGNLGADTSGLFAISDSTKPTVALIAPNGGQSLGGGMSYTVSWARGDNVGIVADSLEYSTDGGAVWTYVWRGTQSGSYGSYDWTVPNTPSTVCLVRAHVRDEAGNTASDASNAVFTITAATQPQLVASPDSIYVTAAGGSDSIGITNTGDASVINYLVSKDSSWITVSRTSGATPGGFSVTAGPNSSGSDRTGYVTVTAAGIAGSPQVIKVAQPTQDVTPPAITVDVPNGGELWDIGSNHNITWTQSDNVGVTLDSVLYSSNGGGAWSYINSGLFPGNGFSWTVPAVVTANGLVKVVARDAAGNRSEDISDAAFNIRDNTAPVLNITQPTVGATWYAGTSRSITWSQSDNIGVTGDTVSYQIDGGVWNTLYTGPATTSYSWSLPNAHTANCVIRVVAYDNAGNRTPQTVAISVLDTIRPTVTVAAPNGGESYGIGVGATISWSHADNIRVMSDSLYYSANDGADWVPVAGVAGATSYGWTVPSDPSTLCRVKVVAIDTAGNKAEDISNGMFTITAATAPSMAVDRDTIAVGWAGGNDIVNVANTGDATVINYTIAADSGWVMISDTAGSTPGSFMVDVANNTSGSARSATVTIDGGAVGGSPAVVVIAQEGQDASPPGVTLTAPNGGESWGIGTVQTITWNQSDNVGVTLDSLLYSTDGGALYSILWSGVGISYDWTIPDAATTTAMVKVVARDAAGNRAEDVSDGPFIIRDGESPAVAVTSPNGGENWSAGGSRIITWTQSDNIGVATDSLHYSADNGASWTALYGGAASVSYNWTVPQLNSSQCLVRVTAYDAAGNWSADASNGVFIIRDTIPPAVALTAPNGGQSLMAGGSYELRWNKSDNIGVVQDSLLYSTDNGGSWAVVWKGLSGTGTYNWTVPNTPSTGCLVKAVVSDAAGNTAADASDAAFTITAASLSYLAVTPSSWNAPAAGGSLVARVSNSGNASVIPYTTGADSAWIGTAGGGATPDSFTITVPANSSGATRAGAVTVDAGAIGGSPFSLAITQPSQDASAPTVMVAVPNGGEIWGIGSSRLIAWSQSDNVGVTLDTVQYSTNNGATWTFLWAGLNTSYSWTVPNTPSALALVRVIARDADGNRSLDASDAPFVIRDEAAPAVTLTAPNGGEVWNTGTAYTVSWTQSDNLGVAADSIYYSADNGTSWIPVYGGAAATSYSWTVPGTPSATCLVRVVAIDVAGNRTADASDAVFRINDNVAPAVTLNAPNGGESWAAGSSHTITWTQSDNAAVVSDSIYFSSDSMATWSPVAAIPAAASYGWTVPEVLSGACFVRVVALDAANNKGSDISNAKFAITIPDTERPRLYTIESDTARMTYGAAFNFKVRAADNKSVKKVQLAFGDAGYAVLFDSVSMYGMGDTSYFYPLPDSRIPRHGLQYRVTATDSAGNATVHPASGFYYHQVFSGQLSVSCLYDKWRMVSFPTNAAGAGVYSLLQDDLGNYDKTKWRLYEYRTSAYVEHGAAPAITNQPGRAYWLRQRVGQTVTVDLDSVVSAAPAGGAVNVTLVNGWVDVGDPYLYNVRWSDIRAATGADTSLIQAVYGYDGSAWSLVAPGAAMVPWQGYSIRASGSGTLRIPATVATKGPDKSDGLWPAGWVGTITVSSGQFRDDNFFGIGEGASTALDRYDYPEPPSGLTGVSGYFTIGDGQYASDLRPALGAGQAWAFAAASQTGANRITVQPPANLPKGAKIFLADLSDQLTQEVTAGGQYEYQAAAANEKRGFKLVVGSDAFAQAEIEKAFTAPAVTLLAQNRPNPVSGKTIISYQLAVPGKVELAVYNIVGQKVRTLVNAAHKAGRYRITWDGGGEDGKRLSNGVYFYRLSAADAVQTRKLTILR